MTTLRRWRESGGGLRAFALLLWLDVGCIALFGEHVPSVLVGLTLVALMWTAMGAAEWFAHRPDNERPPVRLPSVGLNAAVRP